MNNNTDSYRSFHMIAWACSSKHCYCVRHEGSASWSLAGAFPHTKKWITFPVSFSIVYWFLVYTVGRDWND